MSANLHPRSTTTCLLALAVALGTMTGCHRDPNVRKQKYLESGKHYEEQGKYREAVIQFANALKVDKGFAAAHYELGKTYLKMGSGQAAFSELLKTVAADPTNIQARLDLGNLELHGGLPDQAEKQARAILASHPDNPDAYALLAALAAKKGDMGGARTEMDKAVELDPNRSQFHTSVALLDSTTDATSGQTEPELRKALTLDPKNIPAHLALGSVLLRKGDKAGAEQQFLTAVNTDPKNLQALGMTAGFYLQQQQPDKAEKVLKDGLQASPESEPACDLLLDFYMRTNQLDRAEPTFASLAAANPKSYAINYTYARTLLLKRENAKAQTVLDTLVKLNAHSPETALVKSTIELDNDQPTNAIQTLKDAVHDAPENFQLRMALGKMGMLTGDMDTAMQSYQEASHINPHNLQALAGEAEIADRRGDQTLLSQVAGKALTENPNYEPALLWRASVEANRGEMDSAEKDFLAAEQKNPKDPRPFVEMAQIRLHQNKIPEASAELAKAMQVDPNNGGALHLLVLIDMHNKQPDKAMARVKQALAGSPNNGSFLREMAGLQAGAHDFAGARDSAQKALNLNPEDEQAAEILAGVEAAAGQVDTAINFWKGWNAKHPTDSVAPFMIGQLYESKNDVPDAMTWYQKSLQINSRQALAANNMAYMMVEHNLDLDKALSLAEQARSALPRDPNTADTLAWVYYHKGLYGSARDLLENAIQTDRDNPIMEYHLGLAYSKLGDRTNATLHLKRAITLGGTSQVAQQAQQALGTIG